MSNLALKQKLSASDYLEGEKHTPVKHEFVNGDVYAMGGASARHGIIAGNLFAGIHALLEEGCDVFMSDMKLRYERDNEQCFYYPDILVCCDESDNAPYYREKPLLIVEVLSDSTERLDRSEKRARYQKIPELQEYVLIAQNTPRIEIFRRSQEWRCEEYSIEHSFHLESVDMTFKVSDIYRRVNFQTA